MRRSAVPPVQSGLDDLGAACSRLRPNALAGALRDPVRLSHSLQESVLPLRASVLARRLHKWVGLLIGVQVLIWTLSGLYMTAVHIDIIHGDHFVRAPEPRPVDAAKLADPLAVLHDRGGETIRFHWLLDRPTYIVSSQRRASLVDARTGAPLAPPGEAEIRQLAEYWFTGEERLAGVRLITQIPGEIRGREPPVWRADFDGWNKATLYFSPETGELLTRRHELWRAFDFLWMMHIMDYETRDNVNNPLLRTFTWTAALLALSGAWLLLYSFRRRKRARTRA